MKKILTSVMAIGIVLGLLGAGTLSFFSDWEISENNYFEAGKMDLKIDCHSTHMRTFPIDGMYGDYEVELPIHFDEINLVDEQFFYWHDVKPGDYGEATISFHVWDNDAWMWFRLTNLAEGPGETPEPEEEFNPDNGELAENIHVMLWVDDGDNVYEPEEPEYEVAFFEGTLLELADMDWFGEWHLIGCELFYIGWEWNVPTTVGNVIQDDWARFNVQIYAEQYRNNPSPVPPVGDPFADIIVESDCGWAPPAYDQEWFAKARSNNPNFEIAIGTNDAGPEQDTAETTWTSGQQEHFTLEYDSGTGIATFDIENHPTVSYAVPVDGDSTIGITVKALADGITVVEDVTLNDQELLIDYIDTSTCSPAHLWIYGIDLSAGFVLEGYFTMTWVTQPCQECQAMHISID